MMHVRNCKNMWKVALRARTSSNRTTTCLSCISIAKISEMREATFDSPELRNIEVSMATNPQPAIHAHSDDKKRSFQFCCSNSNSRACWIEQRGVHTIAASCF
eukprot:6182215-Pleurochrysis_carterae.AAC.1